MLDHPVIRDMQTWGYPKDSGKYEYVMTDSLGNEIYTGDEYLEIEDDVYLVETLSVDAIEILERFGAERRFADE